MRSDHVPCPGLSHGLGAKPGQLRPWPRSLASAWVLQGAQLSTGFGEIPGAWTHRPRWSLPTGEMQEDGNLSWGGGTNVGALDSHLLGVLQGLVTYSHWQVSSGRRVTQPQYRCSRGRPRTWGDSAPEEASATPFLGQGS